MKNSWRSNLLVGSLVAFLSIIGTYFFTKYFDSRSESGRMLVSIYPAQYQGLYDSDHKDRLPLELQIQDKIITENLDYSRSNAFSKNYSFAYITNLSSKLINDARIRSTCALEAAVVVDNSARYLSKPKEISLGDISPRSRIFIAFYARENVAPGGGCEIIGYHADGGATIREFHYSHERSPSVISVIAVISSMIVLIISNITSNLFAVRTQKRYSEQSQWIREVLQQEPFSLAANINEVRNSIKERENSEK